jgi:polysaccharide export outer membrane protein
MAFCCAFMMLCSMQVRVLSALAQPTSADPGYAVGVGDVLEISVLQPDQFVTSVAVAPDGYISFPYIGKVNVKGSDVLRIQRDLEKKLASGYVKYPVIVVYLKESKSKKYIVSGEIGRPGAYLLEDNLTVLRAISIAGGPTKVANLNHVKILRLKKNGEGYETINVNLNKAMNGDIKEDVALKPEDMIIVNKSFF